MTIKKLILVVVEGVVSVVMIVVATILAFPIDIHRGDGKAMVRAKWKNLLCKVPTPNFEMADEKIWWYWNLPTSSVMSPRMMAIGRCVAAVWSADFVAEVDPSECVCLNVWWVPVVTMVAAWLAVLSLLSFVTIVCNFRKPITADDMRRFGRLNVLRCVLIVASQIAIIINSNEFTVTNYGRLYPSKYVNLEPTAWKAAAILFVVGGFVCHVCTSFFMCCNRKTKVVAEKTSLPSPCFTVYIPSPHPSPSTKSSISLHTNDSPVASTNPPSVMLNMDDEISVITITSSTSRSIIALASDTTDLSSLVSETEKSIKSRFVDEMVNEKEEKTVGVGKKTQDGSEKEK